LPRRAHVRSSRRSGRSPLRLAVAMAATDGRAGPRRCRGPLPAPPRRLQHQTAPTRRSPAAPWPRA